MFENELDQQTQNIAAAGDDVTNRRRSLQSATKWAGNALERLDELVRSKVEKFRRRKAEFGRAVRPDEKPNEIVDQTRKARRYRFGGFTSIGIEVLVAAALVFALARLYEAPVIVALGLAIAVATVTAFIALVKHAGLHLLTDRIGNPLRSLRIVIRYIAMPAFILVVFAVLMLVATRTLSGETLLWLRPLLNAAPFVAAIAFLAFGAALLVVSDILSWSAVDAKEYQQLMSERLHYFEL